MSTKSTLCLTDCPDVHYDTSLDTDTDAQNALQSIHDLKDLEAISDPEECRARSSTPWYATAEHERPRTILFPRTTEDVSAIVQVCAARSIPIVAYGGGTGLGGSLAATRGGVCIDFKKMDKIIALHEDDMDVVVQPGVGWQELNAILAEKKLFFPPDPAPGAKIGGMVAMGCSGTNTYRYGTVREWIISLTVVLADGSIVKTRNRPRKSSAGYNLTQLMIGSEGTLGIVTEAVLKVTRLPQNMHVGLVTFNTTSEAIKAAVFVVNSGIVLEALEFIDGSSMGALNRSGMSKVGWVWEEKPTLFIKFSGPQQIVDAQIDSVKAICTERGAIEVRTFGDSDSVDKVWACRKTILPAFISTKGPDDIFLSADAAVPISKMGDLFEGTEEDMKDIEFFHSCVGHVGDGNTHIAIICPKAHKDKGEELIVMVQRRALQLEGTITGEHGVGLKLRDMLAEEVGQNGVDLMRKLKFSLDPKCILNPDKVVRVKDEGSGSNNPAPMATDKGVVVEGSKL